MAPKKYTNGRKKNDGGNEVLGVGLIIAAGFVLLCIMIPPIIGLVSRAVNGIVTGIFGFTSYPIFICLLLFGVALVRNASPAVSGKTIAALCIAAISLVLILQLALTDRAFNNDFSAYISYVYDKKNATAGVLFGIIAYGMQAGLSRIFSYILLCAILLVSVLVMCGVFGKLHFRSKTTYKKKDLESAKPKFEKSGAQGLAVKPVMDTSLFVGTIDKPAEPEIMTEVGQYSTLAEERPKPKALSGYYSEPVYTPELSQTPPANESDKKAEAMKILYGDKSHTYTSFAAPSSPKPADTNSDATTSYGLPIIQSAPVIRHDTPAKPPKIVHNDLPGIVLPPEKDFSDSIVGGEIINGDALSAELDRTRKQDDTKPEAPKPIPAPFNTKKVEPEDITPQQMPIMNGDYFGIKPVETKPVAKPQPIDTFAPIELPQPAAIDESFGFSDALFAPNKAIIAEQGLPPIYTPETEPIIGQPSVTATNVNDSSAVESGRSTSAEESAPVNLSKPTVRDDYKETESGFEALLRDEKRIRDSKKSPSASDIAEPQPVQTAPVTDNRQEEPARSAAFIMPDEVVDLSEKSFGDGKDYTGYYTKEKNDFEARVNEIETNIRTKKNKPVANQINLDDYNQTAVETPAPKKRQLLHKYAAPPIDLLLNNSTNPEDYGGDCQEKARILEQTLENLKLPAKVSAITKGPAVTRYELEMPPGQSIKRIESYEADIAYNLESNGKIRIETPIPGKRAVGIEVPNEQIAIVALRDIIASKEFQQAKSLLSLALGKDIAGQNIVCTLEKMPHLLIAGATNSGKSACLNSIIMSILYKSSPDDVRLILIDPKEVEFRIYHEMPHLLIPEILTTADQATNAFKWAKEEMDRRYKLLSKYCARNITEFNNTEAVKTGVEEKMYSIVIIVDELAELMLANNHKEFEDRMMSVAQKARAAGIHLILATQRPSVNIITGTIKANLPSRIAFAVTSYVDSKTILDEAGAEALLGRGDMLYAPIDKPEPTRVQGAYVTTEEVATIVSYVKEHNTAYFDEDISVEIMSKKDPVVESAPGDDDDDGFDVLMKSVLKRVIESGQASTSMIQRRFSVGYARASRIIDQMENNKFIGPLDGSKPREVYITREQFREIFGEDIDEVS